MNAQAIKKYFESQYKTDRATIFATRLVPDKSDLFLISDGHLILLQSIMYPVLESRAMFPRLPGEDQSFTYKCDEGRGENDPKIINIWNDAIKDSQAPANITEWCHVNPVDETVARAFVLRDGRHLFIQEKFLNLLVGKKEKLTDYKFLAKSPLSPVIVRNSDNDVPVALFLPLRRQGLKYLTEPVQPDAGTK